MRPIPQFPPRARRARAILALAATAAATLVAGPARADDAADATAARAAFAQVAPEAVRSVVMVRVIAHAQMRLNGVNQPPRTFEREGPATVIAPGGVIASSLSVFDPIKGLPPREGLEFGATIYSSVRLLAEDGAWIDGRVAATAEDEDVIFFAPAEAGDGARFRVLPAAADPDLALFAEYVDLTRSPSAFDRCLIARVSEIQGVARSGRFIFVTSLSLGSPVVDRQGAMLGLGVRVASSGTAATSVLIPAPRLLALAEYKGVVPAPATP